MFYNGFEWMDYPLIPADDPGFLRGYSVYEVIRTYNKVPFALLKHYNRLKHSGDFLGIELPEFPDMLKVVNQAISIHEFNEYRFRIYVTPFTGKNRTFYMFTEELKDEEGLTESGVIVNIARERKPFSPIVPYYVKSPMNGFGEFLRKKYDYYYDTIMLNEFGYVTECTMSNIFIVSGGVLITPNTSAGLLPGITRENIIKLAQSLSIEVEERNIEVIELLSADEVFLSHTSKGMVPVRRIIPNFTYPLPGVVTETLLQSWNDFIKDSQENWDGL